MKKSASSRSGERAEKKSGAGSVTSLDGKRTITADEFDRLFDEGSDQIDDFIDWSNVRRVPPGGPRRGAGRKRGARKPYQIRLRPETHQRLKKEAARRGVSLSELADEKLSRV